MSASPLRPFAVGDAVRLVEIDGDPIPVAQQLRGFISRLPGATGELEVTFPTRDGRGGFDFWPAAECVLDVDPSSIVPFA